RRSEDGDDLGPRGAHGDGPARRLASPGPGQPPPCTRHPAPLARRPTPATAPREKACPFPPCPISPFTRATDLLPTLRASRRNRYVSATDSGRKRANRFTRRLGPD